MKTRALERLVKNVGTLFLALLFHTFFTQTQLNISTLLKHRSWIKMLLIIMQLTPIVNRTIFLASASLVAPGNWLASWDSPSVITIMTFFTFGLEPEFSLKTCRLLGERSAFNVVAWMTIFFLCHYCDIVGENVVLVAHFFVFFSSPLCLTVIKHLIPLHI